MPPSPPLPSPPLPSLPPVAKCIDRYAELSARRFEGAAEQGAGPIDPRLEQVVNRMFQRCFTDHEYKQAIGIALETRRMDILQRAITESVSSSCTHALHPRVDMPPTPTPTGQRSRDAIVHPADLPQPPEQPKAKKQGAFLSPLCSTHLSSVPTPPCPAHPTQVLTLLAELHTNTEKPDYIAVAQCFIFLDQPQNMADILIKLAKGSEVCGRAE